MMKNYATFDFGKSYFRDTPVLQLIKEKLPVSITLGLWMTLLSYLISIPLGIRKAVRDGSRSTPGPRRHHRRLRHSGFLFAILLMVLFAGGSFWADFPAARPVEDNWDSFRWPQQDQGLSLAHHPAGDCDGARRLRHPRFLTKNSFLDEIRKQYVQTARAKGLTERQVLYGHVFRNAMLIVIAGFPGAFIHAFFTGSLLIETIFSLDGLGLLGFESVLNRDYPVVFANLYIFSLIGLVVNLMSDLTYTWIDPRIDFEREV
jgi:microcin C transport system permease protein